MGDLLKRVRLFVFVQEGVELPSAEGGIRLAVRGDMVGGLVFGL